MAVARKGRKKNSGGDLERKVLLAKVHIAKKYLGYDDDLYRMILQNEYGVASAAALSIGELESLVARFQSKGWKPQTTDRRRTTDNRHRVEAMKERIGQELLNADFDEKRFRGLLFKICGVDDLAWCMDPGKLKRLVAVIRSIGRQERKVLNG